MSLVLLTNAANYAGPGALEVLQRHGHQVVCHDAAFVDAASRVAFNARHEMAHALQSQDPDDVFSELMACCGLPDAIVLNDAHPISRNAIEEIPLADLRATFEAVMVLPFRFVQAFLPGMKERSRGALVFVTSARERSPEPGFAVPTATRAATTAFARAVAREAAPFGIQANVVAPNFLQSELYYPRARFVDDEQGRTAVARAVPMGRLGDPAEVGELIAFLVSGSSTFTTGEVIGFTGGWP